MRIGTPSRETVSSSPAVKPKLPSPMIATVGAPGRPIAAPIAADSA